MGVQDNDECNIFDGNAALAWKDNKPSLQNLKIFSVAKKLVQLPI